MAIENERGFKIYKGGVEEIGMLLEQFFIKGSMGRMRNKSI